ncbi:MAG: hypothetical protein AABY22_26200 [Nanoarchaeota archaeon]
MKKHYHNPQGKNNFQISYIEARIDGTCKEWAVCLICNLNCHWRWREDK